MELVQNLYKKSSKQKYDTPFLLLLFFFELFLSLLILYKIPYTEIDWKAYMEEVSTYYDDHEYNYINIKGGTGPLVYPAGFLYLYVAIRHVCNLYAVEEEDRIYVAQFIFVGFYILTFLVMGVLYSKIARRLAPYSNNSSGSGIIWSWRIAIILLTLSKRMHSIFILRLFNDGPTMLCTYISFYFFTYSTKNYQTKKMLYAIGCLFYSYAVGIKMNVLLYAPGLLLILLQEFLLQDTILCLSICAIVQLIIGYPFLSRYPISYLKKAFEFDRVFFYKWTVNWKCLPEDIFISKKLSLLLLGLHVLFLILFTIKWLKATKKQTQSYILQEVHFLTPEYKLYTLFVSNFIGIVMCRTLHYQFYAWYFHSLPFLLWISSKSASLLVIVRNIIVIGCIEYSFNVFPATYASSLILQFCHWFILLHILLVCDLNESVRVVMSG